MLYGRKRGRNGSTYILRSYVWGLYLFSITGTPLNSTMEILNGGCYFPHLGPLEEEEEWRAVCCGYRLG